MLPGTADVAIEVAFIPDGTAIATRGGPCPRERTVQPAGLWPPAWPRPSPAVLHGTDGTVIRPSSEDFSRTALSSPRSAEMAPFVFGMLVPARHAAIPSYGHGDEVWSVAFSPDGRTLASGGRVDGVFLWDLRPASSAASPSPVIQAECETWPSALTVRKLASAGSGRTSCSGMAGRESAVATLAAHTDTVVGLGFSPDGTRLASAGGDKIVVLWDRRLRLVASQGMRAGRPCPHP